MVAVRDAGAMLGEEVVLITGVKFQIRGFTGVGGSTLPLHEDGAGGHVGGVSHNDHGGSRILKIRVIQKGVFLQCGLEGIDGRGVLSSPFPFGGGVFLQHTV